MKKTVALFLFCFVGLNGMKKEPTLQSNLNELKTSLTTLKSKLGNLDAKLKNLKSKISKTAEKKSDPAIEKAITEAISWIDYPASIRDGISALKSLDAQIQINPDNVELKATKLKLYRILGEQAIDRALDKAWADKYPYGTKFSHAIIALKSISFFKDNKLTAEFLNAEDKLKAKASELFAEALKESHQPDGNWIEEFIEEYKKIAPKISAMRINYGQKNRQSFFSDFMGFEEVDFNAQKINDQLIFEEHNKSDGKSNFKIKDATGNIYQCGFLEQISLGELRTLAKAKAKSLKPEDQKTIIFNVIEASGFNCSDPVDIGKLQGDPGNKNAVFQVASNFNALETTSHTDGKNVNKIANYWSDNTQGPRASISALPGLIYRRYYYFYPERKDLVCNLWGQRGQTNNNNIDDQGRKFQINFLEDLPINTMNGYIWGNDGFIEGKFGPIPDKQHPNSSNIANIKEENASKFKIGYHSGIQVAFGATYGGKSGTQEFFYDPSQIIDQVFAAALVTQNAFQQPSDILNEATNERAKVILNWTYEAMLKSAFLKGKRDANGKIKVFLTRIGGGAFANDQEWIDKAIIKAVKDPVLENSGLEITLNNFVLKEGVDDIPGIRRRLIKLAQENHGMYKLYKVNGAYSLTLVGDIIQETKIAK